jgi:hypothetical protein
MRQAEFRSNTMRLEVKSHDRFTVGLSRVHNRPREHPAARPRNFLVNANVIKLIRLTAHDIGERAPFSRVISKPDKSRTCGPNIHWLNKLVSSQASKRRPTGY